MTSTKLGEVIMTPTALLCLRNGCWPGEDDAEHWHYTVHTLGLLQSQMSGSNVLFLCHYKLNIGPGDVRPPKYPKTLHVSMPELMLFCG